MPEWARALTLALLLVTPGASKADPVVIELFTSQGCSSCPPADRLLSRLAGEELEIVPLSFHVDYWNYIGWTDPFSSEAWSDRQRRYARAFETGRIYTPQMVFDGRTDCVGSSEDKVRRLIAEAAARRPAGELKVDVGGADEGRLHLEISAKVMRADAGAEWKVMVAVFEKDLVTSVPRGENAGRSLRNDNVVRSLTEAFSLSARAGSKDSRKLDVELGDGWKREHLGFAVFLQDPASMRIHGAVVRHLEG